MSSALARIVSMKSTTPCELSILLTEDDPEVAQFLVTALQRLGHSVPAVATDGMQAVSLAGQLKPDLAIMDIDLPGLDGIAATRRILRHFSIPVIISTGRTDNEALDDARQLNIQAFLIKPFSVAQLRSAIAVAMMQHQRHDEAQRTISDLNEALDHGSSLSDAEALTPERLVRIGLSKRQAEVLHWIAQGKSNNEIGIILAASPRTVAKHVETIFLKLSVETRMSAVAEARFRLDQR